MSNEPTTYIFYLVDEFSHIALSCAIEPLRIANLVSGQTLYKWVLASQDGVCAQSSNGLKTMVDCGLDSLPKHDRFFVLSGINMRNHCEPKTLQKIRSIYHRGGQIGAICSGSYLLAKAGLLDGMATSIHWEFHDSFLEEFPNVNLVRTVFVSDEKIISSAGGTAAADMMLDQIERHHGSDLAIAVADQMVYSSVRSSTAEQRISLQSRLGMRNRHVAKAVQIMNDNIEEPKSLSAIAKSVGISSRQLERLFGKNMHCSPKKYYLELRLEKARKLLIQTEVSVTEVSLACGFTSTSSFVRAYRTAFGLTPTLQRGKHD